MANLSYKAFNLSLKSLKPWIYMVFFRNTMKNEVWSTMEMIVNLVTSGAMLRDIVSIWCFRWLNKSNLQNISALYLNKNNSSLYFRCDSISKLRVRKVWSEKGLLSSSCRLFFKAILHCRYKECVIVWYAFGSVTGSQWLQRNVFFYYKSRKSVL